jgi:hypothetical protein
MGRDALEALSAGNSVNVSLVVQVTSELARIAAVTAPESQGYAITPPLGRAVGARVQTLANAVTTTRDSLGLTQR